MCVSAVSDSWITPCWPLGLEGDRDSHSTGSHNHNTNPQWDRKCNIEEEKKRAATYR